MPIRSILAIFTGAEEDLPMLETACQLAAAHQAQLRILHVLPDAHMYEGYYAGGTITVSLEEENRQRQEKALRLLENLAERHALPVVSETSPPPRHASICFSHRSGVMEQVVAEEGRFNDLILLRRMSRDQATSAYEGALIGALFEAGRPLLLLPDVKPRMPLEHTIAIAWKNSRETMDAIDRAMPLLARAEKVHLLAVHTGRRGRHFGEQRIVSYLQLHGVNADMHIINAGEDEVGKVLLARAGKLEARLLVMGGYGHSRFREIVFGGVTEYVLNYADTPVLMVH